MLPVVVFGIIKVIVMVLMICQPHFDHEQYLRTIGDALASFLKHRDPHTKDMCLVTAPQIKTGNWSPGPQAYTRKKLRWRQSMSSRRFWTAQGWRVQKCLFYAHTLTFYLGHLHSQSLCPSHSCSRYRARTVVVFLTTWAVPMFSHSSISFLIVRKALPFCLLP